MINSGKGNMMRLATLKNGTPDGQLVIVSPDASGCAAAPVATLQTAMENWDDILPQLLAVTVFDQALEDVIAPLPRAWQWLDGSVYASHGALMDKTLGIEKPPVDFPLMYQGVSDKFYGPTDDVIMASEALNIDFEGEFGIITDFVPMGTSAADAFKHIKLIVQINDWSLRALAGTEMKTGFGWVRAKPPCSMAPFAVTPDALGAEWRDGRVCLDLLVDWNGKRFGAANGEPMGYGFHELVSHAAQTRNLVAGTVIGSGTVSNENFRECGSSCIAERRGIEIVDEGEAKTDFMRYGDTVRMQGTMKDGRAPFGVINQKVVKP
jgi:fumarylacetoacetate (FAA) hydrolase